MQNRIFLLIPLCFMLMTISFASAAPVSKLIHDDLTKLFQSEIKIPENTFKFQQEFESAAEKYALPLPFILTVARGESFFDSSAVSSKGAMGLMQIMPGTAVRYGYSSRDLQDPEKNIDAGVHYLSDLYKRYDDPYLTLAGYYCGEGAVKKGSTDIRKDCNEYVYYLYDHYGKVIAAASASGKDYAGVKSNFVLAEFSHITEIKNFISYITKIMPDIKVDQFRIEEKNSKGIIIFRYQVLASYTNNREKISICNTIEDKTGFTFCM